MAYRIGWYIKDHIIFTRLWGTQSLEDGEAVNQELSRLPSTENLHQVHILLDSSKLEKSPPPSMSSLSTIFRALSSSKISWFIVIGKVSTINSLMGIMLSQLFNLKYQNIATFEQALQFLKEHDGSIQWNAANREILLIPEEDTSFE